VNLSYSQMIEMIDYSSINNTELIKVQVTTDDAKRSLIISEAIAQCAPNIIVKIMGVDSIKVADPPILPTSRSNNNTIRNTAIAGMLGIILSAGICIAYEFFDTRIKSEEQLRLRYNLPILGVISDFNNNYKE